MPLFKRSAGGLGATTICPAPISTASTRCTCWASRRRRAEQLDWNLKALAAAEAADDARARGWRASLLHNLGWTIHDAAITTRALDYWQKALAVREAANDARAHPRRASWTVARGLRSLGRLDEAEAMQRALAAETREGGCAGRLTSTRSWPRSRSPQRRAAARPWAAKAYAVLSDDAWIKANEPATAGAPRASWPACNTVRDRRAMNPAKRRAIFERLRARNPDPRSELEYRTPFELLVAVVLSAQATDKSVNKATAKLFPGRQHARGDRRSSASTG